MNKSGMKEAPYTKMRITSVEAIKNAEGMVIISSRKVYKESNLFTYISVESTSEIVIPQKTQNSYTRLT